MSKNKILGGIVVGMMAIGQSIRGSKTESESNENINELKTRLLNTLNENSENVKKRGCLKKDDQPSEIFLDDNKKNTIEAPNNIIPDLENLGDNNNDSCLNVILQELDNEDSDENNCMEKSNCCDPKVMVSAYSDNNDNVIVVDFNKEKKENNMISACDNNNVIVVDFNKEKKEKKENNMTSACDNNNDKVILEDYNNDKVILEDYNNENVKENNMISVCDNNNVIVVDFNKEKKENNMLSACDDNNVIVVDFNKEKKEKKEKKENNMISTCDNNNNNKVIVEDFNKEKKENNIISACDNNNNKVIVEDYNNENVKENNMISACDNNNKVIVECDKVVEKESTCNEPKVIVECDKVVEKESTCNEPKVIVECDNNNKVIVECDKVVEKESTYNEPKVIIECDKVVENESTCNEPKVIVECNKVVEKESTCNEPKVIVECDKVVEKESTCNEPKVIVECDKVVESCHTKEDNLVNKNEIIANIENLLDDIYPCQQSKSKNSKKCNENDISIDNIDYNVYNVPDKIIVNPDPICTDNCLKTIPVIISDTGLNNDSIGCNEDYHDSIINDNDCFPCKVDVCDSINVKKYTNMSNNNPFICNDNDNTLNKLDKYIGKSSKGKIIKKKNECNNNPKLSCITGSTKPMLKINTEDLICYFSNQTFDIDEIKRKIQLKFGCGSIEVENKTEVKDDLMNFMRENFSEVPDNIIEAIIMDLLPKLDRLYYNPKAMLFLRGR
ncbi:hypothetical protein CPAV1605_46 [seawater metagenome]|uniref:Uncharacterized protein n=1 Tax=seawater metagenome TaxID=1561972 RepID=A0A5E8CI31_9ZZZZ